MICRTRPVRIILVTNGLRVGGAERLIEGLAGELQDAGDEVHVVATTRDGEIGDQLRERGIPVTILGIRTSFDARAPVKLARLARRFRPHVVHSHLEVSDITTAAAKLIGLSSARIVSTVHNLGPSARQPVKKTLWTAALARFDRVLCVSADVKRKLPYDVGAEVLFMSTVSERDAPLPRDVARERLGLAPDAPVVLSVGRLDRDKGFDVLGEAANAVRPSVRFVVIGDGAERSALTAYSRLELRGSLPDAATLLTAADVVVCPSRTEGLPQIILEAMAARCAIIATPVGGVPEAIADGETGVLVPPEAPAVLADAIEAVLADEPRRAAYGEAGRARLLAAGWTREATARRVREVYRALTA